MRHAIRLLICCCVALSSQLALSANVADFAEFNLFDSSSNILLPGRLHIPAGYATDPGADRPLILFLHGSGASGIDNELQLNFNIDNLLAAAKQRDAFLYAPQTNAGWENPTILARAMEMIDHAILERNVDPHRVYVTGLSMGGGGAWNFLNQFPDRVAATVPIIAVAPAFEFDAAALIDEPIWAFHGRSDNTVPVTVTREVIGSFLTEAGLNQPTYLPPFTPGPQVRFDFSPLNLHYTELNGGHGITPTVYQPTTNRAMYDWMFSQFQVPEPTTFILVTSCLLGLSCAHLRFRSPSSPRLVLHPPDSGKMLWRRP